MTKIDRILAATRQRLIRNGYGGTALEVAMYRAYLHAVATHN